MSDPMEDIIASALTECDIPYVTENDERANGLDFYLPEQGIHIEVKQFHSNRIAKQMSKADNVVVAQGREAVEFLAHLIRMW